MCSSWICASRSGTAFGFFSADQPVGARFRASRSTTRLRSESAVRAMEYGSVTLLVTTFWTLGRPHLHGVAVRLALSRTRGPVTDQTPVRVVAAHGDGRARRGRGRRTGRWAPRRTGWGRPWWKTGPSDALRGRRAYRSSSTPAICTPVAASSAPLAARWVAISWPRSAVADPVAVARVDGEGGVRPSAAGSVAFWASVSPPAALLSRSQLPLAGQRAVLDGDAAVGGVDELGGRRPRCRSVARRPCRGRSTAPRTW